MQDNTSTYHQPVMLAETLAAMDLQPSGIYVDLTFGGGGHTRAILSRLGPQGKLIAFDQDPDAVREAHKIEDERLTFVQANFRYLRNFLVYHGMPFVNGILADLGVSSHQLDSTARGFAMRLDGPLDMRMAQQGTTAADLVNSASVRTLASIFREYGELNNAHRVAMLLVAARKEVPITTMQQLRTTIAPCLPPQRTYKYHACLCQALRIAVNDELAALRAMLIQAPDCLKQGGRLTVLAYHSLEDKLVKGFMRTGSLAGEVQKDIFGNLLRPLIPLQRKACKATAWEVAHNPRARSARLRCAMRR